MDLTYGPGELDHKITKKHDSSDMKREHDSVDDFEHLDPEISPVIVQKEEFSSVEKFDTKNIDPFKKDNGNTNSVDNLIDPLMGGSSNLDHGSVSATELLTSNILNPSKSLLSDFEAQSKENNDFGRHGAESVSQSISNFVDFGMGGDTSPEKLISNFEQSAPNTSFIDAEKASKFNDPDAKSDLMHMVASGTNGSFKKDLEKPDEFGNKIAEEFDFETNNTKSMKEADALAQYDLKFDKKEEIEHKEPIKSDFDSEPLSYEKFGSESFPMDLKNYIAICPAKPENDQIEPEEEFSNLEQEIDKPDLYPAETFITNTKNTEISKADPPKEQSSGEAMFDTGLSKPTALPAENSLQSSKKTFVPDLDDIIGPEDVFKRIGLDAWFTPDRLHPTVEALVYWRDPKQSGVVFGSIMAILLSLCYMSLISVVAYSSLLALTATICFRIYKNILQAVQKTSEGHPFKEFLDLDLSLPQDKVRETVDTAVVHINAAIVELRRLFLVEDLIDSIKFAVCLWCLTYVGAIFNGMTLVILAFVALFTVPKIYENNKASIDQYIEMGRSKVAEITSKVKAALPVGKKEPEKDKEQ